MLPLLSYKRSVFPVGFGITELQVSFEAGSVSQGSVGMKWPFKGCALSRRERGGDPICMPPLETSTPRSRGVADTPCSCAKGMVVAVVGGFNRSLHVAAFFS